MVSLWPWKKSDDDTTSFEKTLSALSAKISKANAKRDSLRANSRRYKVLWTLYTSLAYLLSALILTLVTGWRNWGPVEYTVLAGSPVLIYLVRTALSSFYGYRISNTQEHLAQLDKQREEAIEKFKAATKYNSTQQLLEKYGAVPKSKPKPTTPSKNDENASPSQRQKSGQQQQPQSRTGIAPPPTANIRRPGDAGPSVPSQYQQPQSGTPQAQTAHAAFVNSQRPPSPSAEFAPNAFDNRPVQYPSSGPSATAAGASPIAPSRAAAGAEIGDSHGPQWYDRIMDLLLGEDETKAGNRLALLCSSCRLVNGLAPPGARTPEDVGRWRCGSCGEWNGVDKQSEVQRIVMEAGDPEGEGHRNSGDGAEVGDAEEAAVEVVKPESEDAERDEVGEDVVNGETESDLSEVEDASDEPPARVTRSRKAGAKTTS